MAVVSTEQVKVTYTDLLGWPEDGRRYELYDGEVSEVPSPLPRHQLAMFELSVQLRAYARKANGLTIVSPIDIVFNEYNVLQPDIVVFTPARRDHVQPDQVIRVPPDVAVEVLSDGTESNDRGRKLRMFERFGVPEYWILDPVKRTLEVRSLGREGRYELPVIFGRGQTIASTILPGFACEVDSLFEW